MWTYDVVDLSSYLLFADDCALAAGSQEELQRLCDCFSTASRRFGLTISIKKTEVLYQPARGNAYVAPIISIEGKPLNAVEHFKYLGGTISNDAMMQRSNLTLLKLLQLLAD